MSCFYIGEDVPGRMTEVGLDRKSGLYEAHMNQLGKMGWVSPTSCSKMFETRADFFITCLSVVGCLARSQCMSTKDVKFKVSNDN